MSVCCLFEVVDLPKHLPLPLIVIGTAGTAGMIRVLRPTLLDELPKQLASAWRMSSQAVRWWEGIQWRGGGAGCWRRELA